MWRWPTTSPWSGPASAPSSTHAADLELVGEAANGERRSALAVDVAPDVLLMDIRMPVLDGIEATRRITADPRCEAVRVIILTTFDLDEYVYGALRAGASGFLLKDAPPRTWWPPSWWSPPATPSSPPASPAA